MDGALPVTASSHPLLLWELIEGEVAPRLPFLSQLALGRTCRRLAACWHRAVRYMPARAMERAQNEQLLKFVNLQSIDLGNSERCLDPVLPQLPRLHSLGFRWACAVSNATLRTLTQLRELRCQRNWEVTNEGLSTLTSLRSLSLAYSNSPVTSAAIRLLTALTHLEIPDCSNITDEGVSTLTNLTSLGFEDTPSLTDAALFNLTRLRELEVNDKITDAALLSLTNLTSLRLQGSNTLLSDRSVSLLTNLTALHVAEESERITAATILSLPKLRNLGLGGSTVLCDEHLVQLSNLDTLILSFNSTITQKSITTLSNLAELDVVFSSIPVSCLPVLPRLRKLRIGWHQGKQSCAGLEMLTGLTELDSGSLSELTDELLLPLTNLQVLSAPNAFKLTDRSISRLVNLRVLSCPMSIGNSGVSPLVNLEELNLPPRSPITSAGLRSLMGLRIVRGKLREELESVNASNNGQSKHSF